MNATTSSGSPASFLTGFILPFPSVIARAKSLSDRDCTSVEAKSAIVTFIILPMAGLPTPFTPWHAKAHPAPLSRIQRFDRMSGRVS
jgi:hypothetical protein